jgi:anthranilate synthase component 1
LIRKVTGYCHQWLDHVPDLLGVCERFPDRFPYLLENAASGDAGGFSLLLFASDQTLVSDPQSGLDGPGNGETFFDRLEDWYQRESGDWAGAPLPNPEIPFIGGWFIYLSYEMAAEVEDCLTLPANRTGLPNAIARRCPGAVIIIHDSGELKNDRAMVVAESEAIQDEIMHCLDRRGARPTFLRGSGAQILQEIIEEDPERFKASVRRIHDYLLAGDVFQVNVSRPWSGTFQSTADPYRLYESLRFANPAPFAGLMKWGEQVLLSSSPERLVQTSGNIVQTRPIAGTRPRGRDDHHDRSLSDELINNLKERAEHVMLIDLERNDLGRVCKPGSIEVNELMVVESYAHVHHIVSNVRGELKPEASPVDALKAVFPGGTITGCPKVRCMEIIAELEGEGRGPYTGSMGYLGLDGSMDMNILIRTMLLQGRQFTFRTGAGIVADSVPEHEVLETADKARGMLLAVESHGKELKHA